MWGEGTVSDELNAWKGWAKLEEVRLRFTRSLVAHRADFCEPSSRVMPFRRGRDRAG